MQRNQQYYSLFAAAYAFFCEDFGSREKDDMLRLCFEEGYRYNVSNVKNPIEITHTTSYTAPFELAWDGIFITDEKYLLGNYELTYTDGTVVNLGSLTPTQEGTQGLEFYPLPDGTYGVMMGKTQYLEEIEIPATYNGAAVTQILPSGFSYATNLKTIVIPDSVTSIGDNAFIGCAELTTIDIPDGVTSIGWQAFHACKSLTEVVIPDSVTELGESAFGGCSGVTSLTIGAGVTDIYMGITGATFSYMTSLEEIVVSPENPVYHSAGNCLIDTESGTLLMGCNTSVIPDDGSVTAIRLEAFYELPELTEIVIPGSVKSIGEYAFEGCEKLSSVVIGDGVLSIGEFAFYECYELTEIVIPGSVESIGYRAFFLCENLSSVVIEDGVPSIGPGAFEGCSGLTSVVIPVSVERIEYGAFYRCPALTDVYYTGTQSEWDIFKWRIEGDNDKLMNANIHCGYVPN